MEPSPNLPPCAACRYLRRKCRDCIFAPYFPPDNPSKFKSVHSVYGASNVSKFLKGLNPDQRERAANTLAYEAEQRLRDPMLGVAGVVYQLEMEQAQKMEHLQALRMELATYVDPRAMWPMGTNQFPSQPSQASSSSSNMNQHQHEPQSHDQHRSAQVGFDLNASPSPSTPSQSQALGSFEEGSVYNHHLQQQHHHYHPSLFPSGPSPSPSPSGPSPSGPSPSQALGSIEGAVYSHNLQMQMTPKQEPLHAVKIEVASPTAMLPIKTLSNHPSHSPAHADQQLASPAPPQQILQISQRQLEPAAATAKPRLNHQEHQNSTQLAPKSGDEEE
ncbi:LOB domain-containing protein 36-like [Impatiens glandulifera]|uniref:LOB domain-containing protein 36-like n=1 Tax=Impatiens glandulifera TaxID=253017 RepID=UPI001FB08022|nr:LOB domain-containing protein 36-like [Impatiens glandulifera]